MGEYWDTFLVQFCKVELACWDGDPNWLGWILIVIAGWILFMVGISLVMMLAWAVSGAFFRD